MDVERRLLRHFLAALAYRTQKALRGAPPEFASLQAFSRVRTPHELIRHMDSVLGYSRTFFIGGSYKVPPSSDFQAAVAHFYEILADVARHLEVGTAFRGITAWGTLARSIFGRYDPCRPTRDAPSSGRQSCSPGGLLIGGHQIEQSRPRSAAACQPGRGLAGAAL